MCVRGVCVCVRGVCEGCVCACVHAHTMYSTCMCTGPGLVKGWEKGQGFI